jgi:hypothetical protein
MSNIQIEGLTQRQRAIADVLWMINGREQVDLFLASLARDTRQDAELVIEMMVAAMLDEITSAEEAEHLLKEYML